MTGAGYFFLMGIIGVPVGLLVVTIVSEVRMSKVDFICGVCGHGTKRAYLTDYYWEHRAREAQEDSFRGFGCATCSAPITHDVVEHPGFKKALAKLHQSKNNRRLAEQRHQLALEYLKELRALNSNKETERA